MAARIHVQVPARSSAPSKPRPTPETKLKNWGDCSGQESLFTVQQPTEKAK